MVLLDQPRDGTPGGVIRFGHVATQGHVVVDDGARSGMNVGVEEDLLGFFHPVGLKNRIGIYAPDDVGGDGIKAHVPGRRNALRLVLPQHNQRSIGEFFLEFLENRLGLIRRPVVDNDDFFGGNRLMNSGLNTGSNRVFLVVGGNNDSYSGNSIG